MDAAASAALQTKYKKLWTQYKLTVTSLYFNDKPISGQGELWMQNSAVCGPSAPITRCAKPEHGWDAQRKQHCCSTQLVGGATADRALQVAAAVAAPYQVCSAL